MRFFVAAFDNMSPLATMMLPVCHACMNHYNNTPFSMNHRERGNPILTVPPVSETLPGFIAYLRTEEQCVEGTSNENAPNEHSQ